MGFGRSPKIGKIRSKIHDFLDFDESLTYSRGDPQTYL